MKVYANGVLLTGNANGNVYSYTVKNITADTVITVEDVKAENDKLKVCFKDVPKEFEKEVNAGKYKKVSVELYRNLEGKGAYLKAVSFLGAAIPQVKGLEAIKFMEDE